MTSRLFPLVCALFLGLATSPASAHIVERLDLSSLQKTAKTIIVGTVQQQKSFWHKKRIYTVSTLQIQTCFKGACKDKTIAIQQLGGVVGKLGQKAIGVKLLQPKSRVLLYLHRVHALTRVKNVVTPVHRIVGLSQGMMKFVKRNNKEFLVHDLSELAFPTTAKAHNKHEHEHGHKHEHSKIHMYPASTHLKSLTPLKK